MVRRIVRAGYHDAAVGFVDDSGEIQHRRGTTADALHHDPRGLQALTHSGFHFRGTDPAVIAHTYATPTPTLDDAAERTPHRISVGGRQCFVDNAANVVFAENGGMEAVFEAHDMWALA